jgi:hypothetical protein
MVTEERVGLMVTYLKKIERLSSGATRRDASEALHLMVALNLRPDLGQKVEEDHRVHPAVLAAVTI